MAPASERRTSWAQPSLSRDFALLSVAIMFVMLLISAWVAWITYIKHSERIVAELEKETIRIERTLESEIVGTGHLLSAIGRQIATIPGADPHAIAQLLQSFATGNTKYALWSWSDTSHRILVSSNKGVLDEPVDIGDRDYVRRSESDPWITHIGAPVEGRVSERWVIPVALGITDPTGRYLGALTASIDISALTEQISHLVRREGISFAVVSKTFVPLTVVSDNSEFVVTQLPIQRLKDMDLSKRSKGVMSKAGLLSRDDIYSYYLVSTAYPYIIVVGYDNKVSGTIMRSLLWPRLIQIAVLAGFLLSFLWIIRARVIKPVVDLGEAASAVAGGGRFHALARSGPLEIGQLAAQLMRIGDYIAERHLVEEELRDKIALLHQRHQRLQMEVRQRSALLAGLLGEYKKSLRLINSHAQAMKDQVHGPIENKKYRQQAADIHQTGTTLELTVRKLIALSRVDAAAIVTRDEPVQLSALVENARGFVVDAAEGLQNLDILLPDGTLQDITLQMDSLHVQQALSYVLLALAAQVPDRPAVFVRTLRLPAAREEEYVVLAIGRADANTQALTAEMAREALAATEIVQVPPGEDDLGPQLHLSLAQAMLERQQIVLALLNHAEAGLWVLIRFPIRRLWGRDHVEG